MTAYFCAQDYSLQPSDLPVFVMQNPGGYNGATQNSSEVNALGMTPFMGTAGYPDYGRPDEPYQNRLFSQEPSSVQQSPAQLSYFAPRTSVRFFGDSCAQGMMTMHNASPSRLPNSQAVPQAFYPIQTTGTQFFSGQLPYPREQVQEIQQESVLCRAKRQRDENYRYSLGCISRRVRSWMDKSKPYAIEAQTTLEDQLVSDTYNFDGCSDNLYELFDEPRRKRFCSAFLSDSSHVPASTPHSDSSAACVGTPAAASAAMSNPFFIVPDPYVGSITASEDLPPSTNPEPEYIVKFPRQIPPICPTAGLKVQFDMLTDRSVLRNWRCRTDEGDIILRKGRKRFFKRVAVLPPDSWQPNKRPQPWEWAPSGPFALHLGEYVSIYGTNGYPYEIVLIRHIPPALRCFLSLVPVPRELAEQMLNGEKIEPENSLIVHAPVDSVTHKWILNGIRPRDFTREMALEYINKDIEMEKLQKERKKARKNPVVSNTSVSPVLDSNILRLDSIVTASSEEDLTKSPGFHDSPLAGAATATLVISE